MISLRCSRYAVAALFFLARASASVLERVFLIMTEFFGNSIGFYFLGSLKPESNCKTEESSSSSFPSSLVMGSSEDSNDATLGLILRLSAELLVNLNSGKGFWAHLKR